MDCHGIAMKEMTVGGKSKWAVRPPQRMAAEKKTMAVLLCGVPCWCRGYRHGAVMDAHANVMAEP